MSQAPATTEQAQLVIFHLDQQRYALPVERVERALRMVAITPFPKAPAIILGVFDLHGELVPVANVRRRFSRPERAPRLSDALLIARTARRRIALMVDAVEPVTAFAPTELAAPGEVVGGLEYVRGIARLPESGIVFVHDLDACLSLDEEQQLDAALEGGRP